MLESNPTVLSPSVPQIMEYYGLWGEPEAFPPPIKIEAADIIDLMGPTSSTTIHHLGRQLSHNNSVNMNHNSQYSQVSAHPSGESSYQSPEISSHTSQTFDYFSPDPLPASYNKFSEVQAPAPFIENFDYFLPDVSQPHGSLVFTGGHSAMQYQFGEQHTSHSAPSSQSHPPLPHSDYPYWDELHCDQDYVTPKQDCCFSAVSDLDSEELDSKSSVELHSNSTEGSFHTPQKRKVGRPPKKDKKQKQHEKKTGRLWEFIRDLLKNPEYCPSLVKWENAEEGLFRFVNSEKVAQLWGQIKGNPRMTYEKLSRAMRYYYKSHVFEPVLGRRLVYKFGVNATNWRPVNNYMAGVKVYGNAPGRGDIRTNSSIGHSFFFQEQD